MFDRIKVLSTVVLTLILVACGGATDDATTPKDTPASGGQATIEDLYWIIENRDPSLNTSNSASALLRPRVKFTDTALTANDFASIAISGPSGRWAYDEAADFEERFDAEKASFYFPYLYDQDLENGSYVALGTYTVDVALKNGDTASQTLLVPAPGSLETEAYTYAYTENYSLASNPPGAYVALPKRATTESAALDLQASTVDVSFSVTDDKVYNGWVRFYDAAGDQIGYSDYFRNFETGELVTPLNGGASLLTDGTVNTLSLDTTSEQLTLWEPATFSDIASVSVILTDGEQYVGTETNTYDTRSRSGKFNVTIRE